MLAERPKQISCYVSMDEWRAIAIEADCRKVPISAIIKKWLAPKIRELLKKKHG